MELTLPMNYVELEQEEMMYLDGGAYISKLNAKMSLASMGLNPYSLIAGALAVKLVTDLVKWVGSRFGGAWGWIAGAIASWAGSQIMAVGVGLGRAAINNGADISWNWNPFKGSFGVDVKVY